MFGASNVELVTKQRVEHMTEQDRKLSKKSSRNPLETFLGVAEKEHHKAKPEAPGASGSGNEQVRARASSDNDAPHAATL